MPVSKKRKPKRRTTAPIRSSAVGAGGPRSGLASKKKLSRQQIIIYVISALVILSMAIGFLMSNSGPTVGPTPTAAPIVSTPAPDTSTTEEATPAPTQAN